VVVVVVYWRQRAGVKAAVPFCQESDGGSREDEASR